MYEIEIEIEIENVFGNVSGVYLKFEITKSTESNLWTWSKTIKNFIKKCVANFCSADSVNPLDIQVIQSESAGVRK